MITNLLEAIGWEITLPSTIVILALIFRRAIRGEE